MTHGRLKLILGLALVLWLVAGCQLPGPQQPDVSPPEGTSLTVTTRLETVDDLPLILEQLAAFASCQE